MESHLEVLAFDKQVSRNSMPTAISILKFHAKALIKDYGKFWLDVLWDTDIENEKMRTHCCFACGCETMAQRAHIIPVCKGGTNDLGNLHLLCKECHTESEFFETKAAYFVWFSGKDPLNSGSYLRQRNKVAAWMALYDAGKFDLIPAWVKEIADTYNAQKTK